jgi:hypothetical protein
MFLAVQTDYLDHGFVPGYKSSVGCLSEFGRNFMRQIAATAPLNQWTTWVQAISFLSRILPTAVTPAGLPNDPKNMQTLRWASDGHPTWIVLLTMVDGDPENLTLLVDCNDEEMQPLIERIIGWALVRRIALRPSGVVGSRGITAVDLLSDADAEACARPSESQNPDKVVNLGRRQKIRSEQ